MWYFKLLTNNIDFKNSSLIVALTEANGNSCSFTLLPDWNGWKVISFNYADMKFSNTGTPPRPDMVTQITLALVSTATPLTSKKVKTVFDHPIFTIDHPYSLK